MNFNKAFIYTLSTEKTTFQNHAGGYLLFVCKKFYELLYTHIFTL